jgi:hypothetical protein
MTTPLVQCAKCGVPIPVDGLHQEHFHFAPCPNCATAVRVELFPAFHRPLPSGVDGEALVTDEEAGCFYHAGKKAVVPCAECGRFLCALCDCEIKGRHLCPACLDTGRKKGKLKELENQRTLYDNIALSLAIYPLLLFYLTVFTAPMVLFLSIRHWNSPTSLLPRSKLRFLIAMALASLQIAGWTFLFASALFL